ncbi:MAG: hypothetical protein IPK85_00015 [Gemmatimonadetes bacterium]|nr:hypothetical protein [Gemmatimonadota bacterium]
MRFVSFGYGSDHRILTRTNGRGAVTTFAYDVASRVQSASLAMMPGAITRSMTNAQAFGLAAAVDTATVKTTITGPGSGQVTQFRMNRYGAPTSILDAAGRSTLLTRGGGMPGLATYTSNPAGHAVTATYDAQGRICRRRLRHQAASAERPASPGASGIR